MGCVPIYSLCTYYRSKAGLTFDELVALEMYDKEWYSEKEFNTILTRIRAAVLEEQCEYLAADMGHTIIKGADKFQSIEKGVFDQGIDVVSFDPKTGVLHLWESKSGQHIGENDLSTFNNARDELVQQDFDTLLGTNKSTALLAQFPEGGIVQNKVREYLAQGKVEFHVLGSPDTQFSKSLQEQSAGHAS